MSKIVIEDASKMSKMVVDPDEDTPINMELYQACRVGDEDMVVIALRILKDCSETTPLDLACEARDMELISLLLMSEDLLDIEGHSVRTVQVGVHWPVQTSQVRSLSSAKASHSLNFVV
ncbi:hypothetical protein ACOMHN_055817 [Nucella lapillus]